MKRGSILAGAVGLLACVGSGFIATGTSGASPAVSGPKLYVAATGGTDSPNTCRLASDPCATIAYAQTQAPVGATIVLGTGTFTAPISVSQSVNITGKARSGANATIIDPSTTVADTDSSYENGTPGAIAAIVDVTGGATLALKNVEVEGSGAGPSFDSCGGPDFVGVYFHNSSGSLTDVTVDGVQLGPDYFGCQLGLAIYAATDANAATNSTVSLTQTSVTNFDKNAITCSDPGTTCTLSDTVVKGLGPTALTAQNGFQLGFGAAGSITGSTISGDSYTGGGANNSASGILVYDAAATTISGNKVFANDVNIFAGADSGGVNADWSISGNTVSGATDNVPSGTSGSGEGNQYGDGIQIAGVVSSQNPTSVTDNTVNGSYEYGIALYGAAGAQVSSNTTNKNYDGIYVDSGSSGNTLSSNVANGNHRYDYEDASSGAGTSGTANTWTSDTCKPLLDSTPEGLC